MNSLIRMLRWRDDVARGDMIQTKEWTRKYLTFPEDSNSRELNAAVESANLYYTRTGSLLRIGHRYGSNFVIPTQASPQLPIPFG